MISDAYQSQLKKYRKKLTDCGLTIKTLDKSMMKRLLYEFNLSDGLIADLFDVDQSEIVKMCIEWEIY